MTPHAGFTAIFFPYQSFPAYPALVDNGGRDPQAYNLSSQGSTPLHHPWLHLHAVINAWGNAIRTGAVSLSSEILFWLSLCHRVTPDSVSDPRLLFMHNFKRPFFPKYDMPEMYDLARKNLSFLKKVTLPADTSFFGLESAFKTHNVRIQTADNETLGAWFTFADPFYAEHKNTLLSIPTANVSSPESVATSRDDLIRSALRAHPTILFLHGTTGTRVVRFRVEHYQAYATRLRANVLAPDYRGFGDSTGTPSEAGLTVDARASWDWLRAHGASPDSVLVVGSSLGTGVAVQFASALEDEISRPKTEPRIVNPRVGSRHLRVGGQNSTWARGSVVAHERPRGIVLLSPFSKLETLLDTYYILNIIPLFVPLRVIPYLSGKLLALH
jgi:abhydrolase domain-containing protein 12